VSEITCVVDSRSLLGESTYWDPRAKVLWWIDIWGPTIHRFDPATGRDDTWTAPEYLGCLAVRESGGLVLSMTSGFFFFDPVTGTFDPIVDPEADMPDTRFNDGKTDRQGRFWSGSMFEAEGKPPARIASLYRLDPDLTAHRMVEGIGCSNGLAWSPDSRTMYYTDSHTSLVWQWDFDPATGDIDNRRVFIDLGAEGYIVDGATVDADGTYWLTVPFNGKVLAYDPKGNHGDRHAGRPADVLRIRGRTSTALRHLGDAPPFAEALATSRRPAASSQSPASARAACRWCRFGGRSYAGVTRTVASGRSNTSGFSEAQARRPAAA
jgi:sugar lactone lactonase YvrE